MRRHQLRPLEPCGSPCVNQGVAVTGTCKAPLEIPVLLSFYSLFLWPGRELDLKELNTAKHLPYLPFLHLPKALLGALGLQCAVPPQKQKVSRTLEVGWKSLPHKESSPALCGSIYFLKVKNTAAPNGKRLSSEKAPDGKVSSSPKKMKSVFERV